MSADDGDKCVALPDALGEDVDEIEAGGDIVDVEKDAVASELVRQAIVNEPREAGRILSAIADEDAAQHVDVLAPKGH